MTSILNFIKEHTLEIICIGLIIISILVPPRVPVMDSGPSDTYEQLRAELNNLDEALGSVMERIRSYEELIRERDAKIDDLRGYILEENQRTRDTIEALRSGNNTSGDFALESQLIIDESLRILRDLRAGESETSETE